MLTNILSLPITDPVLKFLIILLIILIVPIISDKLRMPQLLGLIIAGVLIGPHSLNLLARDSSIILSGTVGLLYIMFLSGLEIDMNDFRSNVGKSTIMGLYGFLIPMILGTMTGYYLLEYSLLTSVLLASMFASHTLITYPIVSKFGIVRNLAVTISVGSSLITNVLSLLVLAVVVGMAGGEVNKGFWIWLSLSFIGFTLIIALLFPPIGRWFFKRYNDSVSQYIFVLAMVFVGAVLSQFAGIEPIIGAFMAGLALNRLIPGTSPLMNRINFVGSAIFIPFFLIGVGMLIDYRAFSNMETLKVAAIMTGIATLAKYLAALLAQKSFRFTREEGLLIFGLTNAQAAATLAAVLVGYNIIVGETTEGDPIRLLDENVLNGTIIMILVTCTIASFVTQKNARRIALRETSTEDILLGQDEKILMPLSNPNTIEDLVNLSMVLKSKSNTEGLYALNIIQNDGTLPDAEKNAQKILNTAKSLAAAADIQLTTTMRYDLDLVHGVTNVIREAKITDLVLGLHFRKGGDDSFLGQLTSGILFRSNITTFIYNPRQPIATVRRHLVLIPENAEYESGFSFWLARVWNIALNTGAKIVFYADKQCVQLLRDIHQRHPIDLEFHVFTDWHKIPDMLSDVGTDDNLVLVLSREHHLSYKEGMKELPLLLNRNFQEQNFLLIYPSQAQISEEGVVDLTNPSLLETIERIDIIGKTLAGIFRKSN